MECCICYETPKPNTCFFTTSCNHIICLSCFTKIDSTKCPYCRQQLKNIPDEIKIILKKEKPTSNYTHYVDPRLINVSFELIDIIHQIKAISYTHFENIANNISNGQNYELSYLLELRDDLHRENRNIFVIQNNGDRDYYYY